MSDSRCKCTMAISMVGDGCRYCQPQEHIDRLGDIIDDMREEAEPTHYAVIDEYGDILYARRIGGLLDAVEQCEYYIEQCKKDQIMRHQAKGWTVKEVTLHE